ncbi:hypothetical protein HCN44_010372, partial [Aphidius gifuensis]
FKEDIQATPAELVYGTGLRLPGEFFITNDTSTNPQIFLEKHREIMRALKPTPTAHHNKSRMFILKDINTCSHVVQRVSDNIYKININGINKNISIQRLKPAYINKNDTDLDNNPTDKITQQIQQHQWGSSMDPPTRTYKRRNVTFSPGEKRLRREYNAKEILSDSDSVCSSSDCTSTSEGVVYHLFSHSSVVTYCQDTNIDNYWFGTGVTSLNDISLYPMRFLPFLYCDVYFLQICFNSKLFEHVHNHHLKCYCSLISNKISQSEVILYLPVFPSCSCIHMEILLCALI